MTEALGRIVATERKPNTPHEFHFWTAIDSPVGIGTIVRVDVAHPGRRSVLTKLGAENPSWDPAAPGA